MPDNTTGWYENPPRQRSSPVEEPQTQPAQPSHTVTVKAVGPAGFGDSPREFTITEIETKPVSTTTRLVVTRATDCSPPDWYWRLAWQGQSYIIGSHHRWWAGVIENPLNSHERQLAYLGYGLNGVIKQIVLGNAIRVPWEFNA